MSSASALPSGASSVLPAPSRAGSL
ncbi:MAG: hypothetical protein RL033_211, partial [Pseudomonadota bacterium]